MPPIFCLIVSLDISSEKILSSVLLQEASPKTISNVNIINVVSFIFAVSSNMLAHNVSQTAKVPELERGSFHTLTKDN